MKILLLRSAVDRIGERILDIAPDARFVIIEDDASVTGDATGVEVVYWGHGAHGDRRARTFLASWNDPELRWVQGSNAGYDHPIWTDLLDRGVAFTRAADIWVEPMAQYIHAWVLAWSQGLAGQIDRSRAREWTSVQPDDVTARTLAIIGFGGIGRPTARIAKALGMRVIATRRTPGPAPDVDQMYTPDRLHDVLAEADYVALCTPLTDDTRDLIGPAEFAAMRPGAVLINVSRGEVVDEDALADALTTDSIRGATIDVTRTEPLPADSPLWALPNLVITAHQSGEGPRSNERLDALFLDNLERYVNGLPLRNVVAPEG
ncbi:MAG: D-2-hydroxyacid dehydrogenase [Acidimicrobiales bacterium]